MEVDPSALPPRLPTGEIKPARRRKLKPELSFRMSLQTEMRPRRNSFEEEEPLTPTTSEPRTPNSPTKGPTTMSPSISTSAPSPTTSTKTPTTTRSDQIQSNNRQTSTSDMFTEKAPAYHGKVQHPNDDRGNQPAQNEARTSGSLPRMTTTKTGVDPVTQPTSKYVDSLAGYMEKIAMKMKKESFSSVFSTEIPETKKESSNFFFTEVPENVEKREPQKTDKVLQKLVTGVDNRKNLNESSQNIYEFIDMPPLKPVFPSRPPRGFVKTSEATVTTAKPPLGKPSASKKALKNPADIRFWPSHQSSSLPPLTTEDVEQFFEEERKKFSNLKSSTVGAYFRRIVSTAKPSTNPHQSNFFQQLGKRMKESLGSFGRSNEILENEEFQANRTRAQDPDWVFFRGFGGKSPTDIIEPYAIYDIPRPQAPPRRKKFVDKTSRKSRRTVSMTDVRRSTEKEEEEELVLSSGARIRVEPLYDVPRSTPIYAIVNMAAKAKNRTQNKEENVERLTTVQKEEEITHSDNKSGTTNELNDTAEENNAFLNNDHRNESESLFKGSSEEPVVVDTFETANVRTCDDLSTQHNVVASLKSEEGGNVIESKDDEKECLSSRLPEAPPLMSDEVDHSIVENHAAAVDVVTQVQISAACHHSHDVEEEGPCCTQDETRPAAQQFTHTITTAASAAAQVAPMPSSSSLVPIHVEECAGSSSSSNSSSVFYRAEVIDSKKSKQNEKNEDECENSSQVLTSYHEEVSSTESKEANRMYEPQSEINQGSCQEAVPDGLVDKTPSNANNVWSNVDAERHLFISPWNNVENNHRVNPDNNDNLYRHQDLNVEQQQQQQQQQQQTKNSSIHPFARRTKSRYCVEQKKLFSSTSDSSDELKVSTQVDVWDDSFDEIIRTANRSIETAESILSTLRRGEETEIPHVTSLSTQQNTHDNQISPVSDIETNIRRLEKAQDEINAALANFRSVKALNGSALLVDNKMEHKGPPPTPPRPTLKVMSIVAKRKEQFESQKKRSTLPHSQTLQEHMERESPEPSERTTCNEGSSDQTPIRPGRRHSFNSCKSTTTTAAESCDSYYEADVESGSSGAVGREVTGIQNLDNGSSLSDSETGVLQLPNRLKSLWGSFKKKRMEVVRPAPPVPTRSTTNNSLYSCFGEYGAANRVVTNGGGGVEQSTVGIEPQSESSSSYHTPGSPAKQQSESSSSLSSFNPRSNRDSGSSDESSEQGGGHGGAKSSTSTEGGAPQNLTTPQQRKAFYIARELMTSERVFVDVLKLLNVEFREYLQKARKESKNQVIPEPDFQRLFRNLTELQALNEDLLQDFEYRVEHWTESQKIADVIAKKGPFLKLYNNYIREFSNLNDHLEDCCQKLPKFKKLVQEFESRDRCKNLRLQHYMLKPVQRLPQYRLLLEDYLKHLDPDGDDFDDTTAALRIVSEVAEQADNTIKQGENFRRMMKLQNRLGDSIELIRPGRHLIKEGELSKISRKGEDPRYFILLSDCLLYTAYSGNLSTDLMALKLSYKIPLTSLGVKASSKADDFQTEFSITSAVRSCTLRAGTVKERNDWLDALHTAIEEHKMRKRTFKEQWKIPPEPSEKTKPGEVAPVWIPDRRVTMCQKCAVEFTVLVRRHHCRACGQVVCSTCSANKAPLKYRNLSTARVCDTCYDIIESELSKDGALASRFHKRDPSLVRQERYVPGRLRESARGEGAQMCGYLKRKTKSNRNWKKMWYVLKDKVVYVYKAPEDNVAVESFPVLGYILDTALYDKSSDLFEGENSALVFRLTHPGSDAVVFCADNEALRDKWVAVLKDAVNLDNPT